MIIQHLFTTIRKFWYEQVLSYPLKSRAYSLPQRYTNLAPAWLWPQAFNQSSVTLRSLYEADLEAVERLERCCYDGFVAWSLQDFRIDYRYNRSAVYWGLEDQNGQLVGVIAGRFTYKAAHISHLFIAPAWRRQGYAQALVIRWCQLAQRVGCQQVTLEVRETNLVAQAFYQGLGFSVERRLPNYYYTLQEDGLFMVYPLV